MKRLSMWLLAVCCCGGGTGGDADSGAGPDAASPVPDASAADATPALRPWSLRLGAGDNDYLEDVAVGPDGTLVISGYFRDRIDLGGGELVSAGGYDAVVAAFTPAGEHLWSRRLGGPNDDLFATVAVGPDGEAVVAATFSGAVDFGDGPIASAGSSDIFLVRLSADGDLDWARVFGGPDQDVNARVAIDGAGHVLVTGSFYDRIDFGGGDLVSTDAHDIFVAELTPTGQHVWSRGIGGFAGDSAHGLAVTPAGDAVITGWIGNKVDFGGGSLEDGAFVAMLDGDDGSHRWARTWDSPTGGNQGGAAVATDARGDVIVSGWFQNTVDFGGGPIASADHSDVFVAKLDGDDGAHLWSVGFGGDGTDSGQAVTATPDGDVLAAGFFRHSITPGSERFDSAGSVDVFVTRLDGDDGSHVDTHVYGDASADYCRQIAVAADGSVVMAGYFAGQIDFANQTLASAGGTDGFLAFRP